MSTIKQIISGFAAMTVSGIATLASATYLATPAYNCTTNSPIDLIVEVAGVTTNTPTGNMQLVVFAIASYDNTNWQSGPTSGTTTTNEADLTYIGSVPMGAAGTHRKSFNVAAAFGGVLPPYVKFVLKNDLGVALTTGSVVSTAEVSATVT